jgi:hypothetical protein
LQLTSFFHRSNRDFLKFLISPDQRVLQLGCGRGILLDALSPSFGLGIECDPETVSNARQQFPLLSFECGDSEDTAFVNKMVAMGPFDIILLDHILEFSGDIQKLLDGLRPLCANHTRIIATYDGYIWEPFFKLAEALNIRKPFPGTKWLRLTDIANLFSLSQFKIVSTDHRILFPFHLFGLGHFINKYIATLPLLRHLCIRKYIVARPHPLISPIEALSTTIIIPCKNELGNISVAISRIPRFCSELEIIFVEGGSTDGTWNEIQRVISDNPSLDIKAYQQDGVGKGSAVRTGFAKASGDLLMILDADLTVPPEDLPKFYYAACSGVGEFINGTRLVYAMEQGAMRFLNRIANHIFAYLFSFLLNQRFSDTLCGTKVLRRDHYEKLAANRAYFGDFDPFGDFDLIFGAAKLHLDIIEVPVRYAARAYGETQISRFSHGYLLLKMVLYAYKKLKAV